MFLSEESVRSILIAAIQHQGPNLTDDAIKETVDALIDVDRKLRAYDEECWITSEARQPSVDTAS